MCEHKFAQPRHNSAVTKACRVAKWGTWNRDCFFCSTCFLNSLQTQILLCFLQLCLCKLSCYRDSTLWPRFKVTEHFDIGRWHSRRSRPIDQMPLGDSPFHCHASPLQTFGKYRLGVPCLVARVPMTSWHNTQISSKSKLKPHVGVWLGLVAIQGTLGWSQCNLGWPYKKNAVCACFWAVPPVVCSIMVAPVRRSCSHCTVASMLDYSSCVPQWWCVARAFLHDDWN